MAGGTHRPRRLLATLAVAALFAPAAMADAPQSSVSAGDDGVRIQIDRRGPGGGNAGQARVSSRPRAPATATRARPATTVCRLQRVPTSRGLLPRFRNGDPNRPLTPFFVVCSGRVTGIAWLERSGGGQRGATPLSEQLIQQVPLPVGSVRASPSARGITGLESWFWVEGNDGRTVTALVEALGATVEVEATPNGERWDFGDGTGPHEGDLGRATPQRSTVTHMFERASGTAPFTVVLDFEYTVRYRIDGGPWLTLPPVTRSATLTYPVTEVRSQLVAG